MKAGLEPSPPPQEPPGHQGPTAQALQVIAVVVEVRQTQGVAILVAEDADGLHFPVGNSSAWMTYNSPLAPLLVVTSPVPSPAGLGAVEAPTVRPDVGGVAGGGGIGALVDDADGVNVAVAVTVVGAEVIGCGCLDGLDDSLGRVGEGVGASVVVVVVLGVVPAANSAGAAVHGEGP